MSGKYFLVSMATALILTISNLSWAQTANKSAAPTSQMDTRPDPAFRTDAQAGFRNRIRGSQNPEIAEQRSPTISPRTMNPPFREPAPWIQGRFSRPMPNQVVPQMYPRFTPHMDRRNSRDARSPRQSLGMIHESVNLDHIKSMLRITSAQEAIWNKTTKAIQESIAAIRKNRESIDTDAVKKMNSAERFAFITKQRQQLQKPIDAIQSAMDELNETLDTAQKNRARRLLPNLDNLSSLMSPEGEIRDQTNRGSRRDSR